MRKWLHYHWHWIWQTGNGEMGNNCVHVLDVCRWMIGQNQLPSRAMSIGGRFAMADDAETPNTQIAFLEYQPVPIICEVRNVGSKGVGKAGKLRNVDQGVLLVCEGGYFAGDYMGGTVFNNQGQVIKEFKDTRKGNAFETLHLSNWIDTVRSRKPDSLNAEIMQGHLSAGCCHLANISYRLGQQASPEAIRETVRGDAQWADAFERCSEHLRENTIALDVTRATLGPWLNFDSPSGRFTGDFSEEANKLGERRGRAPFVIPAIS